MKKTIFLLLILATVIVSPAPLMARAPQDTHTAYIHRQQVILSQLQADLKAWNDQLKQDTTIASPATRARKMATDRQNIATLKREIKDQRQLLKKEGAHP